MAVLTNPDPSSVNATASGYHGFTQEMSFARLLISTASEEEMPQPSANALPPRDLATVLVQECLQRIFSLYPVLSDTAIFGSLEAVYQHEGHYCAALDRWNVRMVLAIALLGRSQAKDDTQYQSAVRHASIALEQRESVIQPGSVEAVQSILLLVIYSILDPTHYNCWYLVGVASRIMVDIGLHQEPAEETRMKPPRLELRRRIFHCVYSLDRSVMAPSVSLFCSRLTMHRLISMTFTRTLSFSDDSVNVELPFSGLTAQPLLVNSFSSSINSIDISINLVKFRRSQSKYYQDLFGASRTALYEPWQNRCGALEGLNTCFTSLSDSAPAFLKHILHAELFYMCILLVQPLRATRIDPYGISLLFEYSVGYAQSTWLVCHHSRVFNSCTRLELVRATFVAQTLLHLLQDPIGLLFDVKEPSLPPIAPDLALPPLQRRTIPETATKAIDAITQMDQIIDMLGKKFGYPDIYSSFKRESALTLQSLYVRRQHQGSFMSNSTETVTAVRPRIELDNTEIGKAPAEDGWHFHNDSLGYMP